ncbi:V-set domain-containing T-cell activation inhibitor 1-like [Oncorhynchus clarkii lewisi]|uniref:V-set domain-containing T-cell activation inhibitor 1-like n=1 Tax=Oncorhynchus clarkii lewisi TaxID=490388 RepID=UPI0039B85E38
MEMAWVLVSMTLRGLMLVVILLWTVTPTDGGEDCGLPCSFQRGSDELSHWLKVEDKDLNIHSYYYSTYQLKQKSQRFRRRTTLFNDQIPKGNASLLLRGITLQDQGRYKCYTSTIKGNMESFINIAVEAPVHLVDIQLSDDIITCSSTANTNGPNENRVENHFRMKKEERKTEKDNKVSHCRHTSASDRRGDIDPGEDKEER